MRVWHLVFAVASLAMAMSMLREPTGRAFVIVFVTGLGELALGLTAIMALFRTIGAFGQADDLYTHVEAAGATAVVLTIASLTMSTLLLVGAWLVSSLV